MIKYEVFLYDIKDEDGHYVYDTFALGKCIYTDTSKWPDEYGDYEYSIAPASGNYDSNDEYDRVEEKYLVLVNPSKIIFG